MWNFVMVIITFVKRLVALAVQDSAMHQDRLGVIVVQAIVVRLRFVLFQIRALLMGRFVMVIITFVELLVALKILTHAVTRVTVILL